MLQGKRKRFGSFSGRKGTYIPGATGRQGETGAIRLQWLRSLRPEIQHRREDGSGFLDSLMVKAVDFCLFTDEVGEESLLFALDQVNRIMPKHGIGIMVKEARISDRS